MGFHKLGGSMIPEIISVPLVFVIGCYALYKTEMFVRKQQEKERGM